uniref:3-beta hydroxysteroid dehydrogenase/isomerase domain-containing protein n=1 Tax=Aplanochytrium stocchinoi TaxID=215587 RepID=A0A7S3V093_9STRA
MTQVIAPASSPAQAAAAKRSYPPVPKNCVVTGGTGFVGLRLVEMLVERGAKKVIALDVVTPEELPEEVTHSVWRHPNIEYVHGDVTKVETLKNAFKGADCVWHIAAAVGPFHPTEVYDKVNYYGTLNVIEACKACNVPKLIMSSSPSTRMRGEDIDGLKESELPSFEEMQGKWLQPYAASKMRGEVAARKANSDQLMTIAVAPHQVYGPRDNLFMPNMLEAAGTGSLRVFASSHTGYGLNKVCFTHVDNYCHGLIIAERKMFPGSKVLGKFYIVTDGATHTHKEGYGYFWKEVDLMCRYVGFDPIWEKIKLPYWFLMIIAYISNVVGWILGTKLRLNPFNVIVLTMHRWFSIEAATKDLDYEPIIDFKTGWKDCGDWFVTHWKPKFEAKGKQGGNLVTRIAKQSQKKN